MNILLVIDIQKQFADELGQYEKCLKFIKETRKDYYVIGSVFQNSLNSMYNKKLLWTGCQNVSSDDVEYAYDELHFKSGYALDLTETIAELSLKNEELHFDIIGCDADACVMATAFWLWDHNCDFTILTDYVYTTALGFSKETVLKLMKRNFGACVK